MGNQVLHATKKLFFLLKILPASILFFAALLCYLIADLQELKEFRKQDKKG